eukprot:858377-Rhodomonas_salina.1
MPSFRSPRKEDAQPARAADALFVDDGYKNTSDVMATLIQLLRMLRDAYRHRGVPQHLPPTAAHSRCSRY